MPKKVPYNQVAPVANRLIQQMTMAKDMKTIGYWWDAYVSFLQNSGWQVADFEKHELKEIDRGWSPNDQLNLIY
jgi:hypothetical protein